MIYNFNLNFILITMKVMKVNLQFAAYQIFHGELDVYSPKIVRK